VTLVGGYAGALLTEAVRDKRAAEREERARASQREHVVADRRADFQRETLLALQDAISRLVRCAGETAHHDLMASRQRGQWTKAPVGEDLNQRFFTAMVDTNTYVVRVLDEQVRELVTELRDRITTVAVAASSQSEANHALNEVTDLFVAVNGRIGELLRTLY
jgi:predicted component of type VI protein secretion system